MRQQFKNLDTWRGKLTATWVCLAPPTAMVAVFVVGGVTSNTFIVDAHALAAPREDAVFNDLANNVPKQPGVDGSLPTQEKSTVQVPITGTTTGTVQPIPGITGDTSGIPGTVLAAYQKAANDLALAMPGCHLTWPLLAGIGKVESAHASGGKVEPNGNTRGRILGPVLNGGPGMAAIADTDHGVYDGDASWDRAVGPMQFIPGTWTTFGADGNGDGIKDPHNVFDAARAAGDYLCAGGANLADPQGLVQAVLRYNHSMDYVSTVLRWMQTYSTADGDDPGHPGRDHPADRRHRQRRPEQRPDPDRHHDDADSVPDTDGSADDDATDHGPAEHAGADHDVQQPGHPAVLDTDVDEAALDAADHDADADADPHADADTHADPHADADTDPHADANTDVYAGADGDTDRDPDGHSDPGSVRHHDAGGRPDLRVDAGPAGQLSRPG